MDINRISDLVYNKAMEFKRKYSSTLVFRIKKHCKIIAKHINPGEEVLYVFLAQKNERSKDIFNSYVVALTNKRLILARKRMLFGYFFISITPDMFNDLHVKGGIVWGKISIDTIKEEVILSNISIRALNEIETEITEYMMREKKKYKERDLSKEK